MSTNTPERITPEEQQFLAATLSRVFSPAAPIDRQDLFAGRIDHLSRVFDAINTRGQHAVIFGERGVGKTSLANIVKELATVQFPGACLVKINCSQDDTFSSVWRKALDEVVISQDAGGGMGFRPPPAVEGRPLTSFVTDSPTPNELRRLMGSLGKSIFIFDEFDRVSSGQSLFADTIKTLSDASVDCTIVLVGVARNIDGLIAEHGSIERAIVQILMPRMTAAELREILNKALGMARMTMDNDAQTLIVMLSQGLPNITHLLGKASSTEAMRERRLNIDAHDVQQGIRAAIENMSHSIHQAYQEATSSPRKDTLFKEVLLACALADVDALGFFASADVREPLSKIMGRPYDIPGFSQHLDKFSSEDAVRGHVLEKKGANRRFRFRFRNPLLQPFVIMRGIADNLVKEDLLDLLRRQVTR